MSEDTPNSAAARRSSPSGTHWRLEGLDKQLDQIDRDMRAILDRLRQLDDLRADVRELRLILDTIHRDLERQRESVERNDQRLDELERWRAEHEGAARSRALVATGGGLAGGGVIVGLLELLRRFLE